MIDNLYKADTKDIQVTDKTVIETAKKEFPYQDIQEDEQEDEDAPVQSISEVKDKSEKEFVVVYVDKDGLNARK